MGERENGPAVFAGSDPGFSFPSLFFVKKSAPDDVLRRARKKLQNRTFGEAIAEQCRNELSNPNRGVKTDDEIYSLCDGWEPGRFVAAPGTRGFLSRKRKARILKMNRVMLAKARSTPHTTPLLPYLS